jgi:hypothetical protein
VERVRTTCDVADAFVTLDLIAVARGHAGASYIGMATATPGAKEDLT